MAKKKYTFVVLTNPTPGKDAEFNRWYNEQHIPDVLNAAGFVAAQRFKLAETQMAPKLDQTHQYLALYEIETDDLAGSLKDLASRSSQRPGDLTIARPLSFCALSRNAPCPVNPRLKLRKSSVTATVREIEARRAPCRSILRKTMNSRTPCNEFAMESRSEMGSSRVRRSSIRRISISRFMRSRPTISRAA